MNLDRVMYISMTWVIEYTYYFLYSDLPEIGD